MSTEAKDSISHEIHGRLDQEQYQILKRCSEKGNIAEWNSYRAEQPNAEIHLENADLRGGRLEGAQLNEAGLEGARFDGADLLAADLREADLRNANFENANLWGATLSGANLRGASLVSANLENADLRGANLEMANIRGANIEGTIVEGTSLAGATVEADTGNELSDSKEELEVVFDLVDDITYGEFLSLMKCMEDLSLLVSGCTPHLNEVQISHSIEEHTAKMGNEMDNMVSADVPKNVAENLNEILLWAISAGQLGSEESEAKTVADKNDSRERDLLQELLASADLSEDEREVILAKRRLPDMECDRMMEDLRIVADLVGERRINRRR